MSDSENDNENNDESSFTVAKNNWKKTKLTVLIKLNDSQINIQKINNNEDVRVNRNDSSKSPPIFLNQTENWLACLSQDYRDLTTDE